ncbi:MAG: endonuclease/exonuclease/phosphatase family protein [Bacteroidota bacterium]|nr:endonuclease/exonuclease/phosphatase family protein [Bacteroidota bacterium]
MTYNIYHGATLKEDFDLDYLSKVITRQNPDVVFLQEVDRYTKRSRGMDIATELAYRTKLSALFGTAMPFDDGQYGITILSRYPICSSKNYILPYSKGRESRALLVANVKLGSGDTISLMCTHIDQNDKNSDRPIQIKRILNISNTIKYPKILAGDFNMTPDAPELKFLDPYFSRNKRDDEIYTYPSDKPTIKIDYIFFAPQKNFTILNSLVPEETIGSDHRPYIVEAEL